MSTTQTRKKGGTLLADTQKALRQLPTAVMRQYDGDWYVAVVKGVKVTEGLVLVKVARTRSWRLALLEECVASDVTIGNTTYTLHTTKEVEVAEDASTK